MLTMRPWSRNTSCGSCRPPKPPPNQRYRSPGDKAPHLRLPGIVRPTAHAMVLSSDSVSAIEVSKLRAWKRSAPPPADGSGPSLRPAAPGSPVLTCTACDASNVARPGHNFHRNLVRCGRPCKPLCIVWPGPHVPKAGPAQQTPLPST